MTSGGRRPVPWNSLHGQPEGSVLLRDGREKSPCRGGDTQASSTIGHTQRPVPATCQKLCNIRHINAAQAAGMCFIILALIDAVGAIYRSDELLLGLVTPPQNNVLQHGVGMERKASDDMLEGCRDPASRHAARTGAQTRRSISTHLHTLNANDVVR